MEGHIKVEPSVLRNTSEAFSTKANELSNIASEISNLASTLSSAWEGEASTAYIGKIRALDDDVQRMMRMAREHAQDLSDMAANYEQAETQNIQEGESLSGDVIV